MKCMYCGNLESKVVDSRQSDDGTVIRRRRECTNCGRRYTTYETVETTPILVIKNNGNRQAFDAGKLKNGIVKSCEKRPVPMWKIDALVEDISWKNYRIRRLKNEKIFAHRGFRTRLRGDARIYVLQKSRLFKELEGSGVYFRRRDTEAIRRFQREV